ncbi:ATP-grasp domain-containing protein [Streptomyces sp. NPDC002785]|uniref:ATP-grasp domain-containing protein n=1 Tax=Streptomyces sp. NPDC002785 TaxID=3154543 RepID=UPI00332BE652
MLYTRRCPVGAVLLLGGTRIEPVRAAKAAGLRVAYLGAASRTPRTILDSADEYTLFEDPTPERLMRAAREMHRERPFGVAVTMVDRYLEAAALLNEEFGLPANRSDVVRTVNDKHRMRTATLGSACGSVAYGAVHSAEDLRSFAGRHGYPFILKPVDGSASRGIVLVDHDVTLKDTARSVGETVPSPASGWIAEEYLTGPEFSVETFSTDGTHHVLAVTEKFKGDNFVEVGHLVPARVTAADRTAMAAEVAALLDAVGLTEGPAHTEVVLTGRGPRVIETHSRPGGDGIVELVRLATGVDMQQLTFDWLAGKPVDPRPSPVPRASATWFLTPPEGTVTAVTGLDEALAQEGVTEGYTAIGPGDAVHPLRSSDDRGGAVITVADDPDTALARARAAAGRISVTVAPAAAEHGGPVPR